MEKNNKDALSRFICRASYSAGAVCARIGGLKNGIDWMKVSKGLKNAAIDIKESFTDGFESVNPTRNSESEPGTGIPAQTTEKDESIKPSQKIEEMSEEILNEDFEKEIEKLDEGLEEIQIVEK